MRVFFYGKNKVLRKSFDKMNRMFIIANATVFWGIVMELSREERAYLEWLVGGNAHFKELDSGLLVVGRAPVGIVVLDCATCQMASYCQFKCTRH